MTTSAEPSAALYRLFDVEGRLLYVGISMRPEGRFKEHRMDKFWWHLVVRKDIEWHATWEDAQAAENAAIVSESPLYDGTGRKADWPTAHLRRPEDPFWRPAADSLAARIRAGEFPAGARLPQRQRLADEYGISGDSFVRAFIWLRNCHLIDDEQYVLPLSPTHQETQDA